MNNRDYQNLPGISSHWLIAMLDSPATCYRKYLDPQRPPEEPTDAMRFGTLVHALALTPKQLEREFRVIHEGRRTRNGKAEWEWTQAQGWTPIKPAELDRARAIVAALHADPDARKLLRGGQKERTIIRPRAGGLLPLKARLDVHQESRRQVIELKTTWNIAAAEAAMTRYRYELSGAFYRDLVRGLSVIFIFVQTREPYEVLVMPMTRTQLQDGEMQWRTALEMFDTCWRLNQWPELEPAALDDDPLMMNFTPTKAATRQRFEWPVGELAL
jgi:hypothetical protein